MTMRLMAAVAALLLVMASPARSDDECDTVVENVEDAVQVASKVLGAIMDEVTKSKPANDEEKIAARNKFCSASGEFLGISRAYRAVVSDCLRGTKRRDTVSALDGSIKSLQKSISDTCG